MPDMQAAIEIVIALNEWLHLLAMFAGFLVLTWPDTI